MTDAPRPPVPPDPRDRSERLFLVIACVFAAGALAVPRLRKSNAFTAREKTVLAALAFLQTALAVALVAVLVWKGPALYRVWWRYVEQRSRELRGY